MNRTLPRTLVILAFTAHLAGACNGKRGICDTIGVTRDAVHLSKCQGSTITVSFYAYDEYNRPTHFVASCTGVFVDVDRIEYTNGIVSGYVATFIEPEAATCVSGTPAPTSTPAQTNYAAMFGDTGTTTGTGGVWGSGGSIELGGTAGMGSGGGAGGAGSGGSIGTGGFSSSGGGAGGTNCLPLSCAGLRTCCGSWDPSEARTYCLRIIPNIGEDGCAREVLSQRDQGECLEWNLCSSVVGAGGGEGGACGDGTNNQNGIEQCDDGNVLPGDGCNGACKVEPHWRCPPAGACTRMVICGDGAIGAGEVCDDGNTLDKDGCSSTCTVQDPAYQCTAGQPCIRISQCGNRRIEAGENCDDGNTQNGDGCSSNCQLDPGWVCPVPGKACKQAPHGCLPNCEPGDCGDGIKNGTEACDDGVNDGTYGTCNPDCTLAPRCGDGVVQTDYGEQCEPTMSNDSNCTSACRLPGGCGDGRIDPGEQCDDGALLNKGAYGGCAPSCIYAPHCGDGVKNGPEDCDDGILDGSYGGCIPQCKLAPHCGDSITNGPEECDDGDQNGLDGKCTAWCKKII